MVGAGARVEQLTLAHALVLPWGATNIRLIGALQQAQIGDTYLLLEVSVAAHMILVMRQAGDLPLVVSRLFAESVMLLWQGRLGFDTKMRREDAWSS